MSKIIRSIELIRKAEPLALKMSPDGFHLAFSGGKDSQVIYELCKMAGVKFKAIMNVTTIDPPELMKFIRKNYPDVILIRPKKSFFELIKTYWLPTQRQRWCCEKLKEVSGNNKVVITGIRKAESIKRSKRNEFENSRDCKLNKVFLHPILEWSNSDVWKFVRENIGFYCELYDQGYHRIGCIGCVYKTKNEKIKDFIRYPGIKRLIKSEIVVLIEKGKYNGLESSEDVFNWWISGKSLKQYIAYKQQMKIDL